MRNPVAKHNNTYNKPKTFRNRKKEEKLGEVKRDHPKHQPYVRCPTNKAALLEELVGDYDMIDFNEVQE